MAETNAELHARAMQIADAIKKVIDDVQLRKWCLELALKSSSSNPMTLADSMMKFIAEPAKKFIDDLESSAGL